MVDILHRVGIKASSEEVYKALVDARRAGGLVDDRHARGRQAWRRHQVPFQRRRSRDRRLRHEGARARPAERVLWQVSDGPAEWIGTKVRFALKQEGEYSIVLFEHRGLEGTGGVHAPLQHEVGDLPDEPESAGRDRQRGAQPRRRPDQQLALSGGGRFAVIRVGGMPREGRAIIVT